MPESASSSATAELTAREKDAIAESPPRPRLRVRVFRHADSWYSRFVTFASVVHEGFWLGCLSPEDLNAITANHYLHSHEFTSSQHNLRGLFDWESSLLGQYFRPGSRILVAAAGGGREVLALRRAGYPAEGFECSPPLVQASRAIFQQQGEPEGVILCPADQVPTGPAIYNALVVGWTAYSHIPTRRRRVAFLRALRSRALPQSPILVSFFTRNQSSRYERFVYRMANFWRVLFRGRTEPVEHGDHISWCFSHAFGREDLDAELKDAGFRLVHFAGTGDGHAVGIAQ